MFPIMRVLGLIATASEGFIEEEVVIRKILEHLKRWEEPEPRPPPVVPEQVDIQYVPFFCS